MPISLRVDLQFISSLKSIGCGFEEEKMSAFSELNKLIFFKVRFVKYWFSADRNLDIF